jgi:hypothetical protein
MDDSLLDNTDPERSKKPLKPEEEKVDFAEIQQIRKIEKISSQEYIVHLEKERRHIESIQNLASEEVIDMEKIEQSDTQE